MMQVVVLKLDYHDDKVKKKVMKAVSAHSGVVSIDLNSKEMKLTVTGDIDSVCLVSKLRKLCGADIVSVGAPKAPEKKKEEPAKKEEPKKDPAKDELAKLMQAYEAYHKAIQYHPPYYYPPYYHPPYFYVRTVEEDPNPCVLC